MSIRARIGIKEGNKGKSIYLHNNGRPNDVMPILEESFKTKKAVEDLLELGDLSKLGKHLNPIREGHSFENPNKDTVVAYARDRGEKKIKAVEFKRRKELLNQASESMADYIYIFDIQKNEWEIIENFDE